MKRFIVTQATSGLTEYWIIDNSTGKRVDARPNNDQFDDWQELAAFLNSLAGK